MLANIRYYIMFRTRSMGINHMVTHHPHPRYEISQLLESIICNTTTAEIYKWKYDCRLGWSLPYLTKYWLNQITGNMIRYQNKNPYQEPQTRPDRSC